MELKKTYAADLEHRRPTAFLLGLIIACALLFVALEYTTVPADDEDDNELLDDMAKDMSLPPIDDQKDLQSIPTGGGMSKSVTEKLKLDNVNDNAKKEISPNSGESLQPVAPGVTQVAGEAKNSQLSAALPQETANSDNPLDIKVVEQLPMFPGGWVNLMKWLTKNLHYPPQAEQQKIQGKVVVSFLIQKDGTMTNIKLEHSVDPLLDREALRVIHMMPKWKPGVSNGKPCVTMFAIPVVFSL